VATDDGAETTIKSVKHDIFQSTNIWPGLYDGRAIIGTSYKEFVDGVTDEELVERYNKAQEKGDGERRTVWAGAAIGSIKEILPVEQLLSDIRLQAKLQVTAINATFE